MPRRARLIVAGFPLHVVQRGNNGTACFMDDADRRFYLFHLERALAVFDCALHAYCLMGNHVHLLMTPEGPASCSLLMKRVGQLHSQYINRKYRRTGALWDGRYHSFVVHSESYLFNCYRYVEQNPVRAKMVGRPAEHPWSSYRVNARCGPRGIITPHSVYNSLARTDPERASAYSALVDSVLGEAELAQIRLAVRSGQLVA
jgi:putative transposase